MVAAPESQPLAQTLDEDRFNQSPYQDRNIDTPFQYNFLQDINLLHQQNIENICQRNPDDILAGMESSDIFTPHLNGDLDPSASSSWSMIAEVETLDSSPSQPASPYALQQAELPQTITFATNSFLSRNPV